MPWFLVVFCDFSSTRGVERSGDRRRICRGAKIATAKERKRSVYDARRGWSSKGFFDGRLLKILEERKGKNLTWRVFREIGATLVGFNQINLRNLNFDKKIYHILLNMGRGGYYHVKIP